MMSPLFLDSITDVSSVQFGIYTGCTLILFSLANTVLDLTTKAISLLGLKTTDAKEKEERVEIRLTRVEEVTNQVNISLAQISTSLSNLHEIAKETRDNTLSIAKIEARGCTYREKCIENHMPPLLEKK